MSIDFSILPKNKNERDTGINWLATDDKICIYTEDRLFIRKLEKAEVQPYKQGQSGYFFKIDIDQLSIRKTKGATSRKKRTMSPENKEKARLRMIEYHKNKKTQQ